MTLTIFQIVVLAVIQGLAELLPVSSSAHVIAAAKLMHLDPSSPPFTLLLVMLHTGTMFAVIVYFWQAWKRAFFSSRQRLAGFVRVVVIATVVTGVLGLALKFGIERILKRSQHVDRIDVEDTAKKPEIEDLFKHLEILAGALAAAGLLILVSGLRKTGGNERDEITDADAIAIGAIQGLSLPFRGFSRSGSTISVGLLRGVARVKLEEYSFALAVVLTPAVVLLEAKRLVSNKGHTPGSSINLHDFLPGLIGMFFAFLAGLIALKVLSRLLEHGKWWVFGVYCLVAAGGLFAMYLNGF